MPKEISSYLSWIGEFKEEEIIIDIIQDKQSDLQICDADSDVIFEKEQNPLSKDEYINLKSLALKSSQDFHKMYMSIHEKDKTCLPERKTFYGLIPRTANEMYEHTKNVTSYYFGEIGINADNCGTIFECRKRGFELLEMSPDYLNNSVICGSYGEYWSLRKVLRRFIWHDRIHAKAMYRMAIKTFGTDSAEDVYKFGFL